MTEMTTEIIALILMTVGLTVITLSVVVTMVSLFYAGSGSRQILVTGSPQAYAGGYTADDDQPEAPLRFSGRSDPGG